MANLQIRNVQDELYEEIKKIALAEKRSISQQVLFLVKEYLARNKRVNALKSPAQVLLELSGSWVDDRNAEEIVAELRHARTTSTRLPRGL